MKINVILLFILLGFNSYSQTEKGNFMLGLNSFYFFQNIKHNILYPLYIEKITTLNLDGQTSYFIKNDLALGFNISYDNRYDEFLKSHSFLKTEFIGPGIFLKCYIPNSKKVKFFFEPKMVYQKAFNEVSKLSIVNYITKKGRFGAGLGVGIIYFISKHIALELMSNIFFYKNIYNETSNPFVKDIIKKETYDIAFKPAIGFRLIF